MDFCTAHINIIEFYDIMTDGFYHLTGFPLVARYAGASEVVNSANLDQYISNVQNGFCLSPAHG